MPVIRSDPRTDKIKQHFFNVVRKYNAAMIEALQKGFGHDSTPPTTTTIRKDFPEILEYTEWPTGCRITSLGHTLAESEAYDGVLAPFIDYDDGSVNEEGLEAALDSRVRGTVVPILMTLRRHFLKPLVREYILLYEDGEIVRKGAREKDSVKNIVTWSKKKNCKILDVIDVTFPENPVRYVVEEGEHVSLAEKEIERI